MRLITYFLLILTFISVTVFYNTWSLAAEPAKATTATRAVAATKPAAPAKATAPAAPAAAPAAAASPAVGAPSTGGEAVDVSKIQEKYWAQGKESELGVVQNRKFTYAKKFELGVFGGTVSSDPFLNVHHYGLSLGYHFNPIFSAHVRAWKTAVSSSAALQKLEATPPYTTANTNIPKAFYGIEGNANLLYGKVSFLGMSIIYVDLFLLGGAGITDTESGKNFTPFIGLGQKIHLNQYMALHLDYRFMHYNETILSKNPATYQQKEAERTNNTDAITLGIDFTY